MKTVPDLEARVICGEQSRPGRKTEQEQVTQQQEWFDPVLYYVDRVLVSVTAAFLLLTILAQIWMRLMN